MSKKSRGRCSICGSVIIGRDAQHLTKIGYCYKHIPDVLMCRANTSKDNRCKNVALDGYDKCLSHLSKKQKETKKRFDESNYLLVNPSGVVVINNKLYLRVYPDNDYYLKRIFYKDYLATETWKKRSNDAKKRAGYRCQLCNKSNKETYLHTHHRTYERIGNELPEDLTVLCSDCHAKFHDIVTIDDQ